MVLGAAVAGIATAMGVGRTLANHWRNVAMVKAYTGRMVRTVTTGLMALGALELASCLWLVFAVNTRVAPSPLVGRGAGLDRARRVERGRHARRHDGTQAG